MTSNNEESYSEASHGNDADDATLPAGGDVVAQIRAHAAKVRSGEISADEFVAEEGLDVWTAERLPVLPPDETVAFAAPAPAVTAPAAPVPAAPVPPAAPISVPTSVTGGGSLIDGRSAPEVSTSFWTTEQPFRASGIDAPTRSRPGGIPLAAWVAVVIVLIVVASVAIAVTVAATGPLT